MLSIFIFDMVLFDVLRIYNMPKERGCAHSPNIGMSMILALFPSMEEIT